MEPKKLNLIRITQTTAIKIEINTKCGVNLTSLSDQENIDRSGVNLCEITEMTGAVPMAMGRWMLQKKHGIRVNQPGVFSMYRAYRISTQVSLKVA
jgi:hypothetical protein